MVNLLHKVWNQEIPKQLVNMLQQSFITVFRCLNEECVQHVDVVFDRHFPLSLKGDKRKGQGSGLKVFVRENKAIVWNWAKFLKGSSNKAELFQLIEEKITRNRTDHKMVLASQGENVIFSSTIEIDSFSPCNYEEANVRMFFHLKGFSATVHRKISLKTADTDIAVIAISLFHKLDVEEFWIKLGTGVNLEWLPVHLYDENLGERISQGMPVWFESFNGCDTIFAFFGCGKRLAWNTFKSYSAATDVIKFIIITIWLTSYNTEFSDDPVSIKAFTVFTFWKTITTFLWDIRLTYICGLNASKCPLNLWAKY